MATGTKIYVEGHGEGTVAGFNKIFWGANEHSINFDNGTVAQLKLKNVGWWSARLKDISQGPVIVQQVG